MKRLLVLGGGPLQVPVVEEARKLGCYVAAADRNPSAPGLAAAHEAHPVDISDVEAVLALGRRCRIDGVVTAATDYGVLAAAELAASLQLPGLDVAAAQLVKDKGATRRVLDAACGEASSTHLVVRSATEASRLRDTQLFPLMVKPSDGSGSAGITRVNAYEELPAACERAIYASQRGEALIESFFNGVEYGVECFIDAGSPRALIVMKKTMTDPPHFAELGHSISDDPAINERVGKAAERAIQRLGINFGAVNMDVLVDGDNVEVVDVGARMGGNLIGSHIVPLSTGINHVRNVVRVALGMAPIFPQEATREAVATRLLALTPGSVERLPDFAAIEERYDVEVIHRLRVGSVIPRYRTNLDGMGYVVATGGSRVDCEARAGEALKVIDQGIERSEGSRGNGE